MEQLHALKTELEAAGYVLNAFPSEYLDDLPLQPADVAIMSECGFPTIASPGELTFAKEVHPEEGEYILRCLSDEVPQYRHIATAQKIVVFAKDQAKNIIWINTASGNQVTLKDTAADMNRYVNDSLYSFLCSLLLYRQFQNALHLGDHLDAKLLNEQVKPADIARLREALEQIDPAAFSDEFNFWHQALHI